MSENLYQIGNIGAKVIFFMFFFAFFDYNQ